MPEPYIDSDTTMDSDSDPGTEGGAKLEAKEANNSSSNSKNKTGDEKKKKKKKAKNITLSFPRVPTKRKSSSKPSLSTIYQCLDGALVMDLDSKNPRTFAVEKARSKFKNSPIILLKDMDLAMLNLFRTNPQGAEVLSCITPQCEMRNISFDRDQPPTYEYAKLLAMMAVLLADTLESLLKKNGPRKKRARHELVFWVAYVNLEEEISPYA